MYTAGLTGATMGGSSLFGTLGNTASSVGAVASPFTGGTSLLIGSILGGLGSAFESIFASGQENKRKAREMVFMEQQEKPNTIKYPMTPGQQRIASTFGTGATAYSSPFAGNIGAQKQALANRLTALRMKAG